MKPTSRMRRASPWLFAACVAIYLGLLGPWLISAPSTRRCFAASPSSLH